MKHKIQDMLVQAKAAEADNNGWRAVPVLEELLKGEEQADNRWQEAVDAENIAQFFAYQHLPDHLQKISAPFGEAAVNIIHTMPRNPERTVALRKLLEAKDAAVRCMVAK